MNRRAVLHHHEPLHLPPGATDDAQFLRGSRAIGQEALTIGRVGPRTSHYSSAIQGPHPLPIIGDHRIDLRRI